jgi:hypothetical protein
MRTRHLSFVTALVLATAACGGSDDSGAAATTSSTSTTLAVGGASATTPEEESTATTATSAPEPTDPPTTSAPTTEPPSSADCLIGTWSLRSQEFVEQIFSAASAQAEGVTDIAHVGGEYRITLNADGSYLGERLDWQLRIATPQGAIVTTITSEDPGTYSVDGDNISVSDPGSPATVRLQLDVGGTLQDLPVGGTQTVGSDAVSGEGTYTCDGDVLTIDVTDGTFPEGIEATWDRV